MHKIFSFATKTSSDTLGMTNVVDIDESPLCAKKEMWTSKDFANIGFAVVHSDHIVIHLHIYIAVLVVYIRICWKKVIH